MNSKYIKWAGLLGSVLVGGSMAVAGDMQNGVGIILAALSSSGGLFGTKQ